MVRAMPDAPVHGPPPEPEIELLARIARRAVWLLRRVLWFAGATAIGYGLWRGAAPLADGSLPAAAGFVWLCAGLPLLAPARWLFGRGRWRALALAALLWFLPCLLPDDHRHGWVLRVFATVAASLSLAVYATLGRLAEPTQVPPPGGAAG